jgi:hypothetical protein
MKVMPIRYVGDMSASTKFYAALGLTGVHESRSGNWPASRWGRADLAGG